MWFVHSRMFASRLGMPLFLSLHVLFVSAKRKGLYRYTKPLSPSDLRATLRYTVRVSFVRDHINAVLCVLRFLIYGAPSPLADIINP